MPYVQPALRSHPMQEAATVMIQSDCTEADPFTPGDIPSVPEMIEWAPSKIASAVVKDERHIWTAQHAVRCPIIPTVQARLSNGRIVKVSVTKEDVEHDLALLEMSSADNFNLNVPPPLISPPPAIGEPVCIATALPSQGWDCGNVERIGDGYVIFAASGKRGSSGGGVYDLDGHIVAIMSGRLLNPDKSYTGSVIAWTLFDRPKM